MSDLIKTIDEEDNVSDCSEKSLSDEEFQPTRKRRKTATSGGIDPVFEFAGFSDDIWSLKAKQQVVQKKKSTSLDDKILKRLSILNTEAINGTRESVEESEDDSQKEVELPDEVFSTEEMLPSKQKTKLRKHNEDDDIIFSDDELKKDMIVAKAKKRGKAGKIQAVTNYDAEKNETLQNGEFETDISFYQMNLSRPLLKAITSIGFIHPTPIQAAAIPVALAGRDICGCAATGTGKTAAFMLPVLERLLYKPRATTVTRVLCLVPTRELGVQVYNVTKNLASFSDHIHVALAVGGLNIQAQEAELRHNPDVVIATPGRLIDHLGNTPSFSLDSIEILILDEADRMLDEWFAEQLKEIVKQCSPRRQTLLFSATMTDKVKDLVNVSLKEPTKIFVDSNKQVAFNLRQQFVKIRNENDRDAVLCALVVRTFHSKTMIFVPTKKIAHRLHILLGVLGIRIGELHGNLTQLQRLEALKKFKKSAYDVLIATDVAARGLDIPGVQSVLNYTMPPSMMQYIHRCGRTARAGRSGVAVSLVGEQDRKLMKQVAKSATLPVKARIVPPEIISKYRDKVKGHEEEIESIIREEEADRNLAKAEIEVNKAMKLVKESKSSGTSKSFKKAMKNEKRRVWFQSSGERQNELTRLKARAPVKLRKALADAEETSKMKKVVEFQAREAKRKRRNRKRNSESHNDVENELKKKKKLSNFEDQITNVKSAKTFRHISRVEKVQSKAKKLKSKNGIAKDKPWKKRRNNQDKKIKKKYSKRR